MGALCTRTDTRGQVYTSVHGCTWIHAEAHRCEWIYMGVRYTRVYTDVHGCELQIHMDVHGCPRMPQAPHTFLLSQGLPGSGQQPHKLFGAG